MVMALAGIANAAESYPITIKNNNATAKHTYTGYQVFAGTLSENESGKKVLANITWGSGVDGTALLTELQTTADYAACTDAASVADVVATFADSSAKLEAFAEIVGKHLATGIESTTSDNKTYTIAATDAGYYIVKETGVNPETTLSTSGYMVNVVGPTNMNVKDQPLTPDKNVEEAEQKVKANTANVGDTVNFVVDAIHVPSTDGYKTFKFVMKDTLPKGLTFGTVTSVKLDKTGAALADTQYEVTTKETNDGGTEIRVVFKDALNLLKPYEGKEIEIKYTATVNKDAEFGDSGNENEVVFEFTNNPDDEHTGNDFTENEPHGTTPESTTKTYVTKISVKKVDGSGQALAGAEFKLSGTAKNIVVTTGDHFVANNSGNYWLLNDGTYTETAPTDGTKDLYKSETQQYKKESYERAELTGADNADVVAVSNATGDISFEGLKPGTYTLTETGAPVGYNKITVPISFTIKFDTTTKKFAFEGTAPEGVELNNDGTFTITVENKSGVELPSTGGIGTTIFYVAGIVLVLGAAAILVARRKVEAE